MPTCWNSAEELKLILRTRRPDGKLNPDEWNVLAQTLDFADLEVSDLMRPIHELAALHRSASWEEIYTLECILGIDIENEELNLDSVDSVGGLVMVKFGDIPEEGQRVEFEQFDIVVKKRNGPRIVLVRVYPKGGNLEQYHA